MKYADYIITTLIGLGISAAVGIITYFLKQTMNRVAQAEADIKSLEKGCVPLGRYEEDFKKHEKELKELNNTCLKQADFLREISEINRKFDRIEDKIDRDTRHTGDKLDRLLKMIGEAK